MAAKYWVGGGSSTNWNATGSTNWSLTSGGANNAAVPAAGDDVFLDSSANCALNVDTPELQSFNMTSYSGTFSGNNVITIAPSVASSHTCKFAGTVTWSGTLSLKPSNSAVVNLTSAGKISGLVEQNRSGGTVLLSDNLSMPATKSLGLYRGIFNANGYTVSAGSVTTADLGSDVRLGNGTWTITGEDPWTFFSGDALTVGTSLILLSESSSGGKKFNGGGKTYGNVTFSGDNYIIYGSNTFSTLTVNTAGLTNGLLFQAGTTQTVTAFVSDGSVGSLAKISSYTAGTAFTLSKSSGNVDVEYMSIKDSTATGGAVWNASNSTNVSGNSGWTFNTVLASISGSLPLSLSPGATASRVLGTVIAGSLPLSFSIESAHLYNGSYIVSGSLPLSFEPSGIPALLFERTGSLPLSFEPSYAITTDLGYVGDLTVSFEPTNSHTHYPKIVYTYTENGYLVMTISETSSVVIREKKWNDPVVTGGCPQCGTYLYN